MSKAVFIIPRVYFTNPPVVFKEQFTGNGSAKTFTLTGAILNATFSVGSWSVSSLIITSLGDVTKTTGKALYDSALPLLRHRISITDISAAGVVTLDYAPQAENFYVYYWYQPRESDKLASYIRDDVISKVEESEPEIASAIVVDTSAFGGNLSAADDTVQKALDTLDEMTGGVSDHGGLTGLTDDDHTQYQKESEKSQASGYASLGSDTKVPYTEINGHPYKSYTIIETGTGLYTVPAGVRHLIVEMWGGGGGGGGTSGLASNAAWASGGGSGSYCMFSVDVTPAQEFTVSVGAKGAGGAAGNNAGSPGGDTTWGNPVTATAGHGLGGQGQAYGTAMRVTSGGSSTASSGGDLNFQGQSGFFSISNSATVGMSGIGGPNRFGAGGAGRQSHGTGFAPLAGYAGGGGGAASVGAGNNAGGDGTDGVIIVWEYA